MAAPVTVDEFLDVARKSQQIDMARLDAYLRQRGRGIPANPRKLAALLVRGGLMTVFQAQQFLLGKYKGFVLGGYRVVERLGTGGTGTVYLGEHQVLCRRAALKVLPTPFADDPIILERFRREAQAAAALDHPNVVHVYDFRQESALHFIVMEYIEGPDLQQVITRRGPLPIGRACEYIRQAAVGLQHAHDTGLVHRDVKPANLLVDSSGTVKVLDLGLALYQPGGESTVTQQLDSNVVLGTADYLAPEQALNLHEVDGRADVYSLGATLYALLAGQPPFPKGTIGQKLMWHQMKEPEPINAVRPDVPAELAAVVTRMLAKKPEHRFPSMAEVVTALEPWAEPAPACEAPRSSRSSIDLRGVTAAGPLSNARRHVPKPPAEDTISARSRDTTAMESPAGEARPPEPPLPAAGSSVKGIGKRLLKFVGITSRAHEKNG
jgi:serine/threonine protein kinase